MRQHAPHPSWPYPGLHEFTAYGVYNVERSPTPAIRGLLVVTRLDKHGCGKRVAVARGQVEGGQCLWGYGSLDMNTSLGVDQLPHYPHVSGHSHAEQRVSVSGGAKLADTTPQQHLHHL